MTSAEQALAFALVATPLLAGCATQVPRTERVADAVAAVGAIVTAIVGLAVVALAFLDLDEPLRRSMVTLDVAAGVFLVPVLVVGTASVLLSPSYLRERERSFFARAHAHRWYYLALFLFWAALLALPLAGNLGAAWLLVEATTAASAMLVAYSGERNALEAGWKYLVLTTAGLTVALLGIVIVYVAAPGSAGKLSGLDWTALARNAPGLPHGAAVSGLVLIIVGLAAKIGWAPVHNWLPDAHSEAPPPVSALLSAALLPAVVLVAWRTTRALEPATGTDTAHNILIGFGVLSLAVAVPFLWRPLVWKRLLAYSSLEHMGVIALGIGFGSRLALAGVMIHVVGHALAKALGFYVATPLLRLQPAAAIRPPRGLAQLNLPIAGALAVSLISLSGLPPSPLFFSEVFVLLGGVYSGHAAIAAVAAGLLALGFLGLVHALIEALGGRARAVVVRVPDRQIATVTVVFVGGLVVLSAAAAATPHSAIVDALARWAG
ncbi:MAG: proton-conducting transporter transmembrane domain-containing protein [Gaiellaceae bacterium]